MILNKNDERIEEENGIILSVIVPTYNVEKYLDKCLSSFIIDEYIGEFEVLIINDGSTDNSAIIASKYESEHPEIFKYVEKQNGGHGSAINVGKQWAEGKYIQVVDSDDWVCQEEFIKLLSYLKKSDYDVVFSNYNLYDNKSQKVTPVYVLNDLSMPAGEITLSQVEGLATIHAVVFKKSIIENMTLHEKCYYDDVQYTIYPFLSAKSFAYSGATVYMYRVNNSAQSVSIKNIYKNRLHLKNILEELVDFYNQKGHEISNDIREYVFYGICKNVLTHYNRYTYFILTKHKTRSEIVEFDKWLRSVSLPIYKTTGFCSRGKYLIKLRKRNFVFAFPYGIAYWINKKIKKK